MLPGQDPLSADEKRALLQARQDKAKSLLKTLREYNQQIKDDPTSSLEHEQQKIWLRKEIFWLNTNKNKLSTASADNRLTEIEQEFINFKNANEKALSELNSESQPQIINDDENSNLSENENPDAHYILLEDDDTDFDPSVNKVPPKKSPIPYSASAVSLNNLVGSSSTPPPSSRSVPPTRTQSPATLFGSQSVIPNAPASAAAASGSSSHSKPLSNASEFSIDSPKNYLSERFQNNFVEAAFKDELESLESYIEAKLNRKSSIYSEKPSLDSDSDSDFNFEPPPTIAVSASSTPERKVSHEVLPPYDPFAEFEKQSPEQIAEFFLKKLLCIQDYMLMHISDYPQKNAIQELKEKMEKMISFAKGQIADEACWALSAMKKSFIATKKLTPTKKSLIDFFKLVSQFCDNALIIDSSITKKILIRSSGVEERLKKIKKNCENYIKYLDKAIDIHIYLVELPRKPIAHEILVRAPNDISDEIPIVSSCIDSSTSLPFLRMPLGRPIVPLLSSQEDIPKECFMGEFTVTKTANRFITLALKPNSNYKSKENHARYIVFEALPPHIVYANGTNHMLKNRLQNNPHGHTFLLDITSPKTHEIEDISGSNEMFKSIAEFVLQRHTGQQYDINGGWRNKANWKSEERHQLIIAREKITAKPPEHHSGGFHMKK